MKRFAFLICRQVDDRRVVEVHSEDFDDAVRVVESTDYDNWQRFHFDQFVSYVINLCCKCKAFPSLARWPITNEEGKEIGARFSLECPCQTSGLQESPTDAAHKWNAAQGGDANFGGFNVVKID